MPLKVAILGRPNVGKSTLFNRLAGKRLALVDDTPGVTRDRREADGRIADLRFGIIDTAGLEVDQSDSLEGRMRLQTERALAAADIVFLLIDARAGITPLDKHFADWLRRQPVPVVLLANKCEGRAGEPGLLESYALGLGEPIAVSAAHGDGMVEIYDVLRAAEFEAAAGQQPDDGGGLPDGEAMADDTVPDAEEDPIIQIAIAGRPNVGKSTLVNRLLGEERLLTGPNPGVTRDAIAVDWHHGGRQYKLVDTAGMRRRARVQEKLEKMAVHDAMRAVDMAQVVVLLVDAMAPMERQDLTIAARVVKEGRAMVVAVNKWDLVDDPQAVLQLTRERLEDSLPQLRGVPVVTVSALTGRGLNRLLPAIHGAYDRWNLRVPTARLNRWLADVLNQHPPPAVSGRHIRLRYATQAKTRPPTFAIFASRPDKLPASYVRYLVNSLRDNFQLDGVPIRVALRKGRNPYA